MRVLLPPSETKRSGGSSAFALEQLTFPALLQRRRTLRDAVVTLAADREASARALKLGPRQLDEILRNADLLTAPGMSAVDRFDGVLYEALDAASLSEQERVSLGRRVLIQSALWGPIGALDAIPAYRLSHDSRVPGISLKRWWADAAGEVLATLSGLVLDLRSEAYAALGPLMFSETRWFVRVRSRDSDGQLRNLNHVNKKSKGLFVRALVQDGVAATTLAELMGWADGRGFELTRGRSAHELDLIIAENKI
ncbi:YaaA family protein [Rathayibacter toxicus]|uniref:Peroxide stress protein YaaA n=1 Tax=Rathayibacter toxicus TaxID=145458 RepID=A0A0C5BT86_9MICO|nr:peroxide stress protein YaaA [Rathayibacter toxicus]AJM77887.1 hypothetical protein TI83_07880 [Rathayibacter toxicus]ALS57920.1 hypothetical protein APU90_09205 [Rathayibacter toxicus]KKM46887.1 hypothetical protein VT73_01010 [Rathayibacter toxicus]PPG20401.1 peroxide stress protein YaaA [Rathayibacter toxicus]PPG45503.1 peroxide stress protein YaaA [Rathayibacter toxicus]